MSKDFVLVSVTYPPDACAPSVAVTRESSVGAAITHLRRLGLGNVKRGGILGTVDEVGLEDLDVDRLATHVAVGEGVDGPWRYLPRSRET